MGGEDYGKIARGATACRRASEPDQAIEENCQCVLVSVVGIVDAASAKECLILYAECLYSDGQRSNEPE